MKSNTNQTKGHIMVYGTHRCPYTVKMLNELKNKNANYTFVDTNTSLGNKKFMETIKQFQLNKMPGVPFMTYGNKYFVGYTSYESLSKNFFM
jgi:glutaredoxin-related protein